MLNVQGVADDYFLRLTIATAVPGDLGDPSAHGFGYVGAAHDRRFRTVGLDMS
jgi:hypothetical protein